MLEGDVAGFGSSQVLSPGGPGTARYVTGQIVLDADAFKDSGSQQAGYLAGRATVLHELGHVVGLGHVPDLNELMHESNVGQTALGPGDRAGLARVGVGHCFTDT